MKTYPIWCEGYEVTGNSGTAQWLGYASGITFEEACIKFFENGDANYLIMNQMPVRDLDESHQD